MIRLTISKDGGRVLSSWLIINHKIGSHGLISAGSQPRDVVTDAGIRDQRAKLVNLQNDSLPAPGTDRIELLSEDSPDPGRITGFSSTGLTVVGKGA